MASILGNPLAFRSGRVLPPSLAYQLRYRLVLTLYNTVCFKMPRYTDPYCSLCLFKRPRALYHERRAIDKQSWVESLATRFVILHDPVLRKTSKYISASDLHIEWCDQRRKKGGKRILCGTS